MIENPWEWANEIGHTFRTHDDIIASWESVVEILDVHAQVVHYGGPGHWADPGTFLFVETLSHDQNSKSILT